MSVTTNLTAIEVYNGSTAVAGTEYSLKPDDDVTRAFVGRLVTSDTMILEVGMDGSNWATHTIFTTATFQGILIGAFAWFRFRKTGTAGTAVVDGMI